MKDNVWKIVNIVAIVLLSIDLLIVVSSLVFFAIYQSGITGVLYNSSIITVVSIIFLVFNLALFIFASMVLLYKVCVGRKIK